MNDVNGVVDSDPAAEPVPPLPSTLPAAAEAAAANNPAVRPPKKRVQPKSARRRSREIALQGIYEWLVSGAEPRLVDAHVREQNDFDKCDTAHFDALLHGCIREAAAIDEVLARHVDRKTTMVSPVGHGVLMIGV